ncbi:MAG: acetyl-CoA carboxylase biotin carboxyl carrier protein [Campylobacteraceae bacterium]|nr:acetyl-CoA carboxylase biotin carboxyl carrier protein [Campylobacteraceae bacterium]
MTQEDIKELILLFKDAQNINKMKLKQNDFSLELEKTPSQNIPLSPVFPQESVFQEIKSPCVSHQEDKKSNSPCITSPMVGTFYKAPSPEAKAFAEVGDIISKGQTVAIVEAMKIMNEIEAEYDCKIVKILVEDGQPVEYEMPLFEVEKL